MKVNKNIYDRIFSDPIESLNNDIWDQLFNTKTSYKYFVKSFIHNVKKCDNAQFILLINQSIARLKDTNSTTSLNSFKILAAGIVCCYTSFGLKEISNTKIHKSINMSIEKKVLENINLAENNILFLSICILNYTTIISLMNPDNKDIKLPIYHSLLSIIFTTPHTSVSNYQMSLIDLLTLYFQINIKSPGTLITFINRDNIFKIIIAMLKNYLEEKLDRFTELYDSYFQTKLITALTSLMGYEYQELPYLDCQNDASILKFIYFIIQDPKICAKLIGCDFYDNLRGGIFLFPSTSPNGLIEVLFEYTAAILFSIKEKRQLITIDICLDIINHMITNKILREYIHLYPACRPLRSYFHHIANTTVEVNLFPDYIIVCISVFLSSHINVFIPLNIYQKCITLIYNMIKYELESHLKVDGPWLQVWRSFISLLSFLKTNFETSQPIISPLSLIFTKHIFNLIDIFLTSSDQILLRMEQYDEMLYEIVRNRNIFLDIFDSVETCLEIELVKESATQLYPHLYNTKKIINSFLSELSSEKFLNISDFSQPLIRKFICDTLGDLELYKYSNIENLYTPNPIHSIDDVFEAIADRVVINVENYFSTP